MKTSYRIPGGSLLVNLLEDEASGVEEVVLGVLDGFLLPAASHVPPASASLTLAASNRSINILHCRLDDLQDQIFIAGRYRRQVLCDRHTGPPQWEPKVEGVFPTYVTSCTEATKSIFCFKNIIEVPLF